MKVLILTIWYPNAENPILGTFVHEQAVALRAAGVDIQVVQPVPSSPFPISLFKESYRKLAKMPAKEDYEGFTIYHPRYITLPRHFLFERVGDWMFRAIRPLVKRIYEDWPFDIIHAHTTYPCGYAANLLRDHDFPSVKVVHTIHRTCIIDAPNYNSRCCEKVRVALEGADRDVFVSLEGKGLALKYTEGRCERKAEYITNGVDTMKFQLDDAAKLQVAELKARHRSTWNLVFVGYLSERKGIKELLPAVANLVASGKSNLHLFLVGRNDLGSYIEDFIASHGLSDNVTLVGPVLHDRVKVWMSFADAFILPSHSEGLPTVLFESLYAGAPSIFTRVGGVGDIVENGREAILIEPKSIAAIEEAIMRLMDSPELCSEMSRRGHQLISERFTWEINARRHLELYEQLAGTGRPLGVGVPESL